MRSPNGIRGAGGGKGGGKPRAPVEAPDSLRSVSFARLLHLLSEGEVFGPAIEGSPLRCIYYNRVPIENADGSHNFTDFQIEVRNGTQTQDYIKGFDSTENEIGVGVTLGDTVSYTYSTTNTDLDALRVRLATPSLYKVNTENGDINGHSVPYFFSMNVDGGGFQSIFTSAMTGKTNSAYARSHRVEFPPFTSSIQLRVQRNSAEANKSNIQDGLVVQAVTELVDAKLRYPMSALVAHVISAEQFNSIPSVAYHWKGRIIRVPTNYNPDTRAYTGSWDGTFKTAYSNNPAWVFYDMATNTRYGMGHRIPEALVDKWTLYAIGQYCDELVADGFGGTEPRFTCNTFLQTRDQAAVVMQNLASVFRGIMYAAGNELFASADMPKDVSFTYAPANVLEGRFTYMGSGQKARHSVALVAWNDMGNFAQTAIEYVDDEESIARFGVRQVEVTAVGCTSRGQARRLGRYILLTERYETDTVNFDVGMDGNIPMPGDVIAIADPLRAGKRMGGRLRAGTTTSVLVLDALPEDAAVGDEITVILPSGMPEKRVVSAVDTLTKSVTVPALSALPVAQAMWLWESTTIKAQTFRVLALAEKSPGTVYSVTALQFVPGKFEAIENNLEVDERPIGTNGNIPGAITNLALTTFVRYGHNVAFNVVNADWDSVPNASRYVIQWQKDNGPWTAPQTLSESNFDYESPFTGRYRCRVWGENAFGITGPSVTSSYLTVTDAMLPPQVLIPDANGRVPINCRYVQFSLEVSSVVTIGDFTNVAQQDSIIIEVSQLGGGEIVFDSNIHSVSGKVFSMPTTPGAKLLLGFATNDSGGTWNAVWQTGGDADGAQIIVSVDPEIAGNTWDVGTSGSGAPSVTLTATVAGTTSPVTHAWTRTDTNGGVDFLISDAAVANPTFTIAAGTTAYSATQTWRDTVVSDEGLTAFDDAQITLARVAAGEVGFAVYLPPVVGGACTAYPGEPCDPTAPVSVDFEGGVAPYSFTMTKVSGGPMSCSYTSPVGGDTTITFRLSSGTSNYESTAIWRIDALDANGLPASDTIEVTLTRNSTA